MKKKLFYLVIALAISGFSNMFAVNFSLSGKTYKWLNFGPSSGSQINIDEEIDPKVNYEPMDSVKILIFYGSTFTLIDTTKPKLLDSTWSDSKGDFTLKCSLDIKKYKKIAVVADKKGYIIGTKYYMLDEKKKEYKSSVLMVKKIIMPRK